MKREREVRGGRRGEEKQRMRVGADDSCVQVACCSGGGGGCGGGGGDRPHTATAAVFRCRSERGRGGRETRPSCVKKMAASSSGSSTSTSTSNADVRYDK